MIKSFFILLLTTLLFLATFGYVVYRLQDPEFVVDQSRSVNLYGRLVGNIGGFLPEDELIKSGFNNADVIEVLKVGMDGDKFYELGETALKAYLPWLMGKTDSLSFTYPLQETRTKLTEGIPDSLSVNQPPTQLTAARTNIALAFRVIYAIWAVTLLLALLYLLIFRSSGFIALAICFLLVGLLQIAFSLVGWDWITKTIGDFVGGSGEAKSIAPIIIDLVSVILGAMKTVMGNISIGFLTSGGVLLVLGIIGKIHHSPLIPKDVR